jgi:hypothetical protein
MQSKNTQYNQRKRVENEHTKYKDLVKENIKIDLIIGKARHKVDITFPDGNHIVWFFTVVGNNIMVGKPRMWEYTMEKLAVMDWLTDTIFLNEVYTIVEDSELHVPDKRVTKHKVKGELDSSGSLVYMLATETFVVDDFIGYGIKINSKVAKNYKFPTHKL